MSYQLAGMQEAQAMEFPAVDYSCLPEFPDEVSDNELAYCNGVDDFKSFMAGQIDSPQRIHNHYYMAGWEWEKTHYFNPEFLVKK
jgi:hypothetical protein